jgi:nucleoside phosphorylase
MNIEQELLLSSEELPETSSTITFEVSSDTRGIERKKGLAGKITLNPDRCHVFFVPPVDGLSGQQVITPDRSKWDLYLVIIPYTLHKAPDHQYYEEMTFFVEMSHAEVTAFDLFPKTINTKIEEIKTYTLSPQIKFKEVEVSLGGMSRQFRFDVLRPSIIALGEGENTFYWVHKGFKEQKEVVPETKHALVVLQVPRGTQSVEANISYEVVTARRFLEVWKSTYGQTDTYKLQLQLRDASSFFMTAESERGTQTPTVDANLHISSPQAMSMGSPEVTIGPTEPAHFDVCVVCAMSEEVEAFILMTERLSSTSFKRAFSRHTNSEFHYTTIQSVDGEPLSIHVSWPPNYGPVEAGLHLRPILNEFKPRFAAMTGVCAGDKRKVKLGDLVVADRTFMYDNGKVISGPDGRPIYQQDVDIRHPDQNVLQFARMFDEWRPVLVALSRPISRHQQRDWLLSRLVKDTELSVDNISEQVLKRHAPDWQSIVRELQDGLEPFLTRDRKLRDISQVKALRFGEGGFPYQDPREPICHIAPMASGNTVRADNPFDMVQRTVRGTLAIDMEGAVFYRVLADFPGIRAILVKGICDYADSSKDDSYHQYAASASAMYVISFIRSYMTVSRF